MFTFRTHGPSSTQLDQPNWVNQPDQLNWVNPAGPTQLIHLDQLNWTSLNASYPLHPNNLTSYTSFSAHHISSFRDHVFFADQNEHQRQ